MDVFTNSRLLHSRDSCNYEIHSLISIDGINYYGKSLISYEDINLLKTDVEKLKDCLRKLMKNSDDAAWDSIDFEKHVKSIGDYVG